MKKLLYVFCALLLLCSSRITSLAKPPCVTTNTAVYDTVCRNHLPFIWNFISVSSPNGNATANYLTQGVGGCDSIVTLHLTIRNPSTYTQNVVACKGTLPYLWNGIQVNAAGNSVATYTTQNSVGCDSVVTLNLSLSGSVDTQHVSICNSQLPYSWLGQQVIAAGTHAASFTTANSAGCDSTIILNLSIKPNVTHVVAATICGGQIYVFGSLHPDTSGTYVQTFPAANTCDSTVTLHLTVNPLWHVAENVSICASQLPYTWNSTTITTGNTATATFTTPSMVTGCDSTTTLHLIINPLPIVNLGNDTAFCVGDTLTLNAGNTGASYIWDNAAITQTRSVATSGTYTVKVTDTNNCASIDSIHVLVKTLPSVQYIDATYEDSATYHFNPLGTAYTTGYTWDFGDGSPVDTAAIAEHQYRANGIYTVKLRLEGVCGVTDTSIFVYLFDAVLPTGIHDLNNTADLHLYPNPAKNFITIESSVNLHFQQVLIFNVLGQMLYKEKTDNSNKLPLDMTPFAPGIYTLKIATDKGWLIRKFEVKR